MKNLPKNVIKCPHCGAEYLPAEIFLPNNLLGKPYGIEKDDNGHIEFFFGDDMDLNEVYRCDFCNKKFNVEMSIKFNTGTSTNYDTDDYRTKLVKQCLFLNED